MESPIRAYDPRYRRYLSHLDGAGYSNGVGNDDEARAFLIARELIAEHGDDVAAFLQAKIDALMASGDLEQLSAWASFETPSS